MVVQISLIIHWQSILVVVVARWALLSEVRNLRLVKLNFGLTYIQPNLTSMYAEVVTFEAV